MTPHQFASEYEFRGDGGDHVPTENERAMIEDAIEGYLSAAQAAPWQPIETAPRDETKIDIWLENKGNSEASYRMPNAWWSKSKQNWTWEGQWNGRLGPNWVVTHWMQRPASPLSSTQEKTPVGMRNVPVLVPDKNSASGHRVEYLCIEVDGDLARLLDASEIPLHHRAEGQS